MVLAADFKIDCVVSAHVVDLTDGQLTTRRVPRLLWTMSSVQDSQPLRALGGDVPLPYEGYSRIDVARGALLTPIGDDSCHLVLLDTFNLRGARDSSGHVPTQMERLSSYSVFLDVVIRGIRLALFQLRRCCSSMSPERTLRLRNSPLYAMLRRRLEAASARLKRKSQKAKNVSVEGYAINRPRQKLQSRYAYAESSSDSDGNEDRDRNNVSAKLLENVCLELVAFSDKPSLEYEKLVDKLRGRVKQILKGVDTQRFITKFSSSRQRTALK